MYIYIYIYHVIWKIKYERKVDDKNFSVSISFNPSLLFFHSYLLFMIIMNHASLIKPVKNARKSWLN